MFLIYLSLNVMVHCNLEIISKISLQLRQKESMYNFTAIIHNRYMENPSQDFSYRSCPTKDKEQVMR